VSSLSSRPKSRIVRSSGRVRRLVAVIALASLAGQASVAPASGAEPPESGIVCTTSPTSTFDFTTRTGNVGFPDGNTVLMWSYALSTGEFQLPGPTLCVTEGSTVTIVLHNTLSEGVSLVFPGQTGVTADGAPAAPQFDGSNLVSLIQAAPSGGSVTYSFTAAHAGTYLYESGTDPVKQVQMGLFGALVVRPAVEGTAYGSGTDSAYNAATEYVMMMSEVDPDLHQAVERGLKFDPAAYHPRYWMLNGRSFPDTIAPNNASWLPSQPYSSFIHMQPKSASNPLPALVRYINVGTRTHPFHPHGNHGRIIARDGRLLSTSADDMSYEKFLVNVGPGQTWDVLYDWTNTENWNPDSNPIPVTLPNQQDIRFKDDATWFSGSAYLGYQDELPVGVTSYNECGEYYQMWHSHALNEAANYEAGFGGMMTLQRIDPPGGHALDTGKPC
jgi:FtsP/CotA-like multicopper oxidase with cupredoxin domain